MTLPRLYFGRYVNFGRLESHPVLFAKLDLYSKVVFWHLIFIFYSSLFAGLCCY